jgi:hypothetical protein
MKANEAVFVWFLDPKTGFGFELADLPASASTLYRSQ